MIYNPSLIFLTVKNDFHSQTISKKYYKIRNQNEYFHKYNFGTINDCELVSYRVALKGDISCSIYIQAQVLQLFLYSRC